MEVLDLCKKTKRIVTDRLVLRRFDISDSNDMLNNWISIPEVQNNYGEEIITTSIEVEEKLKTWIVEYGGDYFFRWAIVDKETNTNIGMIAFYKVNAKNRRVEVEYCIGKDYWYKGFATEALRAVVDFAFDELNLNRVEAFHRSKNPSSGRVLEKVGMKQEGTLKQYLVHNNEYDDCHIYAIIRNDWKKA